MSDKVTELTEGLLKSLMPGLFTSMGHVGDLDTCLITGIYRVSANTKNIPEGQYQYGILIVFHEIIDGKTYAVQLYFQDYARLDTLEGLLGRFTPPMEEIASTEL